MSKTTQRKESIVMAGYKAAKMADSNPAIIRGLHDPEEIKDIRNWLCPYGPCVCRGWWRMGWHQYWTVKPRPSTRIISGFLHNILNKIMKKVKR